MKNFSFEVNSYAKDYIVRRKLIGTIVLKESDRTMFGYAGKTTEVLTQDVILSNGKIIRKGTEVETEVNPICGRAKDPNIYEINKNK
jgi:hypothetical protein